MPSLRNQEGYIQIDHRNSPGVPVEIIQAARAAGKDFPLAGEGANWESATVTCSHCNTVVVINPDRARPRSYCRKCDHYICDGCAALGECRPFESILIDLHNQAYHKHE